LGDVCTRGGGNVQTGPFGSQLHAEDYQEQGVPIITVEHLNELSISHNNLPLVGKEDYIRLKKYDLRTGDLVFSRVGAIDRCSFVTDKEHGWLFSGRCLRVRAGNAINSKYLAFVLNSFRQRQWILNSAVGSTMACLNTTILSNVPIAVPQSNEQNFVADALFDDFIGENHLKSDLKKLEAIKTGLMQDLLTGRRRVTPELIQQVETLTHSVD
jgi:type I restriction enzyme S subunit